MLKSASAFKPGSRNISRPSASKRAVDESTNCGSLLENAGIEERVDDFLQLGIDGIEPRHRRPAGQGFDDLGHVLRLDAGVPRSEERRVGKECRSRRSPD